MKLIRPLLHFDGGCIPWRLIGVLALLFGIAIPQFTYADSYWRWSHPPYPVRGIMEMPFPGGRTDYLGNANYWTGYIEIRPGMRDVLRDCVIKHERKHFECCTHEERAGWAVDCGDGSLVLIDPQ